LVKFLPVTRIPLTGMPVRLMLMSWALGGTVAWAGGSRCGRTTFGTTTWITREYDQRHGHRGQRSPQQHARGHAEREGECRVAGRGHAPCAEGDDRLKPGQPERGGLADN
jgi:hypothetical protein